MKTARVLVAAMSVFRAGWIVCAQPAATKQVPQPKAAPAPDKATPSTPKAKDEPAKGPSSKAPDGKSNEVKSTEAKPARSEETESADEAAIRHSAEAFTKAYNGHDAKAISQLFALKAEMTDEDGQLLKGRDAIEKDFAQTFSEFPDGKVQVEIDSIRVLTPNIAVEEGTVRGQPSKDLPENLSSYIAVHVKVDGKWLIASVSDFEVAAELTPNDHLQELAWMVGDWIEETPDSHIKSTCRWDETGNYLLQNFVMHIPGGAVASGSIRIGWDQLTGQFKSWAFEADGSYSEGLWTHEGDEWIVKARGANSRGEATSATNVYRVINGDTMSWRSYDRVSGGKRQVPVPEMIIKRHAPSPQG